MDNLIQSVTTALYIVVLWFPLAIFIIFKIIFMKNNMDWGKTKHGTAKVVQDLSVEKKQSKEKETETLIKV